MLPIKKTIPFILFLVAHYAIQGQVNIAYRANKDILVQSGDKKIIIDGLFDDYYEAFLSPDKVLVQNMYNGQSPFDQINLVLATHIHRDHYEAQIAGKFLSSHYES